MRPTAPATTARLPRLPGQAIAAAVLAAIGLAHPAAAAETPAPLVLERRIPLPGTAGRIDHMAVDLRRGRLFVAELGNGTMDVVDLGGGAVVQRIGPLREPQGVAYDPASDTVAVANAGDGSVRLYRGASYAPSGRVELGDNADNVRLDPTANRFVVGYGSGGLAAIDPGSGRVTARVTLSAHPEGFRLDRTGRRAFVNLPDRHQIAVVELDGRRPAEIWALPDLSGNFPLALDERETTLAIVSRNPPRLLLLDPANGQPRARLEACGDADDVFFDTRRERIYVICGSGSVDVFAAATGGYARVARIATASGARTALFVPELDRLFVAARAGFLGLGSDAAILVFRPGD